MLMAGQITGAESVLQALKDGVDIDRVLVDREKDTEEICLLYTSPSPRDG